MGDTDIRWRQRFSNYKKALNRLREAVVSVQELSNNPESSLILNLDLLKEGLVQRFEFTHELAWKVMTDYLEYQGENDIKGSRDAFRKSLAIGLIDSPLWIDSIKVRNITSHTYDEDIIDNLFNVIIDEYYPLMLEFDNRMTQIDQDENQ